MHLCEFSKTATVVVHQRLGIAWGGWQTAQAADERGERTGRGGPQREEKKVNFSAHTKGFEEGVDVNQFCVQAVHLAAVADVDELLDKQLRRFRLSRA
jgi:hypothetical protein